MLERLVKWFLVKAQPCNVFMQRPFEMYFGLDGNDNKDGNFYFFF